MEPILASAEGKNIKYVVHVSDIHIRTGDLEKCRYVEYNDVFSNFVEQVSKLEHLEETVLVITGDIFHNKGKIEPAGIKLAHSLLIGLLEHTDVIMICGNHDYRQDNPSIPDMIESIYEDYINQNVHTRHRAYYFNNTGYYLYNNVCFTVVHIKDMLKNYNTVGKNEDIFSFPSKMSFPNVDYTIALFHGTVFQNSNLPNTYDIEWFGNHDYIMLGDIHKMQWYNDRGRLWAYSGSLIQQDFGETFMEHGFLVWDLANRTVYPHIVFNNYGFCTVKSDDNLMVHIKQRQWKNIDSFDTFPVYASFRTLLKDDISRIETYCKKKDLKPTCILHWSGASLACNEEQEQPEKVSSHHIEELNTTDKWFEYLGKHTDVNQIKQFILHPELLKLPNIDEGCDFLKKHTARNDKIQKVIDEYISETSKINKTVHRVQLIRMQWSYLMCYGDANYFDFDTLHGTIALLNGKNAMGKSSFLDVLCIALYGEPTKMRNIVNGRRYTDKIIHDQRPMNKAAPSVRLTFTIGNEIYEIYRTFSSQAAKSKEHLIMQTCIQLYKYNDGIKILVCEGSTLVDKWISEHIGTMETVLMSSMICQTDLNNFFHLKQDDQKAILDKALRLETVSLYGKILKESILAHNDIVQQIKTAKQTMDSVAPCNRSDEKEDIDLRITELEKAILEKKSWRSVILSHNTRIVKECEIDENIDVLFSHAESQYIAKSPPNDTYSSSIVYRERIDAIKENIKDAVIIENDEALYNKWKAKYDIFLSKKPQYNDDATPPSEPPCIEERPPLSVSEYEELLMHFTKVRQPPFPEISVNTTLTDYEESVNTYKQLLENPVEKNRTQSEYEEWQKSYPESATTIATTVGNVKKRLRMYENKVKNAKMPRDTSDFEFNSECSSCAKNRKCCEGTKQPLLTKWKNIVEECRSIEKYILEKSYWDSIIVKWKEYDEWKEAIEYHSKIIREYEQSYEWMIYNRKEEEHNDLIKNYQLAKFYAEKDEWDNNETARELYSVWCKEEQVVLEKLKKYNNSMKKRELDKLYAEYAKCKELEDIRKDYEKFRDMFYSKKLHDADRDLDSYNKEYSKLVVEKAKLEASIDAYNKHMNAYANIIRLEKIYESRLIKIKELDLFFIGDKVNSDGYKEWIYKTQVIPLINSEMNAFLGMFENFKFDMSYTKKNFIYMIEDRGNKPTLDKASGYQNFIICLAFRIILARIGAVGQQLKHLFIDEGFTACDSVNIEKVPKLLKSILTYGEYSSLLLMSHLDSVRECTSIHINIERADPFSYIRFPKTFKHPSHNTINAE